MKPRERLRAVLQHREPDRVPVDFGKHIGSLHRDAYQALRAHLPELELPPEPAILDRMAQNVRLDEVLCRRLGIDFRWIVPHWVGVRDEEVAGASGYRDMWGVPHAFVPTGCHYVPMGCPLGAEQLTTGDIEAYAWPDPRNPAMVAGLADEARGLYEGSDLVVGADGIKTGILQTAAQLRGYDKLFLDFALRPDLAHALLERISGLTNSMYRHYLRAVGRYVQVVVITDDQGTQSSLMISPAMFRTFIKPRLAALVATIKAESDAAVLLHSDGAIEPIIGDLIEIGVDILNPIQTTAAGMDDTRSLKETYGDRLCFHGAIDVQRVLRQLPPDEVALEVRRRVADLGRDGGYILAPCHNIDDGISPEQTLALFDAARIEGAYRGAAIEKRETT